MGRDSRVLIVAIAVSISIHAPRVGRDKKKGPTPQGKTISIHAPRVGRDLPPRGGGERRKKFQSTRPVWGATWQPPSCLRASSYFNPRAPCGARRPSAVPERVRRRFQSTRPVWGATMVVRRMTPLECISIHAPRVGRDQTAPQERSYSIYFNPRAPCGARLWRSPALQSQIYFNPRAPCGARPLSAI